MGHVEKRIRDKGVVWRARYRDPANRERNKTFTRKIDAERFVASVETSIAKGDWADPASDASPSPSGLRSGLPPSGD